MDQNATKRNFSLNSISVITRTKSKEKSNLGLTFGLTRAPEFMLHQQIPQIFTLIRFYVDSQTHLLNIAKAILE